MNKYRGDIHKVVAFKDLNPVNIQINEDKMFNIK